MAVCISTKRNAQADFLEYVITACHALKKNVTKILFQKLFQKEMAAAAFQLFQVEFESRN